MQHLIPIPSPTQVGETADSQWISIVEDQDTPVCLQFSETRGKLWAAGKRNKYLCASDDLVLCRNLLVIAS